MTEKKKPFDWKESSDYDWKHGGEKLFPEGEQKKLGDELLALRIRTAVQRLREAYHQDWEQEFINQYVGRIEERIQEGELTVDNFEDELRNELSLLPQKEAISRAQGHNKKAGVIAIRIALLRQILNV